MRPLHLLIAITVTCLWGFNFSIIKLGVQHTNPFLLTALRFSFACLPLIFFVSKPDTSWWNISIYGITFGVGVWGMMSLSIEQGLSAGMASTIIQASSIMSIFIGVIYFGEKLKTSQVIGLLISSLGLAMIFYIEDGSVTLKGFLFAFIGATSLSLVNFLIKKAQIKKMFAFIVYSSLFAPLPLLLMAFITDDLLSLSNNMLHINETVIFSALMQAYPTTLLGYWAWNRLLTRYPLSVMSPLRLLVPIFGLAGSILFFGEPIDRFKLVAFLLVLIGVCMPLISKVWRPASNYLRTFNSTVKKQNTHKRR